MNVYAIIENGRVVNTGVSVGPWPFANQTAVRINGVEAGVGWTYDGVAFSPPPTTEPRFITKLDLYARATDAELAALETFLQTGATVRQRLRWADAQVIDRADPEVIALTTTLFGAARAAELLA